MGRSKRFFAAVALVLGCELPMVAAFAAPAFASGRAPTAGKPPAGRSALSWTAERIRVEPAHGTAGVTVTGVGTFRGAVELARTSTGLAVVNEVAFEDYVKGISEVPNTWPVEALKAQAIASRTYALWEYRRQGAGDYRAVGAHICATQSCQVYTGLAKERAPEGTRWTAAVEATRSQVLWWRDAPIVAKYSSSNGGEIVPGGRPYLRGGADPDDAYSPLHRWRVVIPVDQLATALGLAGRKVSAIQRSGDDVLVTAKIDPHRPDEEPVHLTMHALDFRDRLNATVPAPGDLPRTLPTVRFAPTLSPEGGEVSFDGRGWGHGIGMSQWGAYGKARRGMKAPEILAAYYAGLKPVALPAEQVPATIKVAVATRSGPTTLVPADEGGRLRVTTSAGETLAHGSTGMWWATPAKGGVALAPAAGQEGPAHVALKDGQPTTLAVGAPVEVKVHLSEHATFAARAVPPGATEPTPVGEPQVLPAGDVILRMAAASAPGPYTITIDTDRGGGRVGSTTLTLDVTPAGAGTSGGSEAGGTGNGPGERAAVAAATAGFRRLPGIDGVGPVTSVVVIAIAALAIVGARAARIALGPGRPRPLH